MAENENWVVTLSEATSIPDVRKKLTENGFAVEQVLGEIGCIIGTADESSVRQLRSIAGVIDISKAPPQVNIGPPDADIS